MEPANKKQKSDELTYTIGLLREVPREKQKNDAPVINIKKEEPIDVEKTDIQENARKFAELIEAKKKMKSQDNLRNTCQTIINQVLAAFVDNSDFVKLTLKTERIPFGLVPQIYMTIKKGESTDIFGVSHKDIGEFARNHEAAIVIMYEIINELGLKGLMSIEAPGSTNADAYITETIFTQQVANTANDIKDVINVH
jgi:hypothetical protein